MISLSNNYYKILGVDNKATSEQIKKAYKKLALQNHPDKNPNFDAKEKFQLISAAYDTLKDPDQKKKYDLKLLISSIIFKDLVSKYFKHNTNFSHQSYKESNPNFFLISFKTDTDFTNYYS